MKDMGVIFPTGPVLLVPLTADQPLTTSLVSVLAQGSVRLRLPWAHGRDPTRVPLPGWQCRREAVSGELFPALPGFSPAGCQHQPLLDACHGALGEVESSPITLRSGWLEAEEEEEEAAEFWALVPGPPPAQVTAGRQSGQSHPCPLKHCQLCP